MFNNRLTKAMVFVWLWTQCLLSGCVFCNSLLDFQVENYASIFHKTLDSHLEEKLALTEIKSMIRSHEGELGIRKINGTLEFQRIFLSIQLRFADLQQSVGHLKSVIENLLNGLSVSNQGPSISLTSMPMPGVPPISGTLNSHQGPVPPVPPPAVGNIKPPQISGLGPLLPLGQCCGNAGPFVYNGKFREKVSLKECYENIDDHLKAVRSSGIIGKMKVR